MFLVCGEDVSVAVEFLNLGVFFIVSADEVVGCILVEVDVEVVDEVVGPPVVVDVVLLAP